MHGGRDGGSADGARGPRRVAVADGGGMSFIATEAAAASAGTASGVLEAVAAAGVTGGDTASPLAEGVAGTG